MSVWAWLEGVWLGGSGDELLLVECVCGWNKNSLVWSGDFECELLGREVAVCVPDCNGSVIAERDSGGPWAWGVLGVELSSDGLEPGQP